MGSTEPLESVLTRSFPKPRSDDDWDKLHLQLLWPWLTTTANVSTITYAPSCVVFSAADVHYRVCWLIIHRLNSASRRFDVLTNVGGNAEFDTFLTNFDFEDRITIGENVVVHLVLAHILMRSLLKQRSSRLTTSSSCLESI